MLGGRVRFEDISHRLKDYWNELDESQRSLRRAVLIVLVLGAIAVPGWYFGRPAWERWQRGRQLEQVRVFSERNDYHSAVLALRRAIESEPNDPATWQEAAQLLSEIGSPEVLSAREQLARLQPADLGAKLALAADALRFERPDVAQATLADLTGAARRDEAFFRLAASLALTLGRADEVEANLAQLVAAAPHDMVARFDYAAARLWSAELPKRDEARRDLESMLTEPKVRIRAAVELMKEAARQAEDRRADEVVLVMMRRFVPGWRGSARDVNMAAWAGLLERMKIVAAADGPEATAVLAQWLGDIGQARETLLWLEDLPANLRAASAIEEVMAQLSANVGDLDRVERLLRQGAWGVWPRDVLTLAMAAHLQRQRYEEAHGKATWADAITAAGDSPAGLRALVRLASAWGQADDTEAALQALVAHAPASVWAYAALQNLYAEKRDLRRLWELHDRWVRQMPLDDQVAERWIVLGCMLNRTSPELIARAEAIHEAHRLDAAATIALAAVRWRQGRPQETLTLIGALPADEQAKPGAALWVGLAQADLGNRSHARAALLVAWRVGLSNEEASLIQAAAAKANFELPSR